MNEIQEAKLSEDLSALLDGELSHSESAFLWKRLEHDEGLRAQLECYRNIGDVMRGQSSALAGQDFAGLVMARIKSDGTAHRVADPSLGRSSWSRLAAGAALAATVAAVALQFPLRDAGLDAAVPVYAGVSRAEAAQPTLLLSPLVGTDTVSERRGAMPSLLVPESAHLPFDEYLMLHTQADSGRAALAPFVYVVGERDNKYLPK